MPLNIVVFCRSVSTEFEILNQNNEKNIEDKNIESLTDNIPVSYEGKDFAVFKTKLLQVKKEESTFSIFKRIKLLFPFLRSVEEKKFVESAKKIKLGYKLSLHARINENCTKILDEIQSRSEGKINFDATEYEYLNSSLKLMADRIKDSKTFFDRFRPKKEAETKLEETSTRLKNFDATIIRSSKTESVTMQSATFRKEVPGTKKKRQLNGIKVIGRNELPKGWDDNIDIFDSGQEILKDINSFLENRKNSKLSHAANMLNSYLTVRQQTKDNPNESATLMLRQVQNLKVGDQCILPGGYYDKINNDGHALVYSIQKTGEDEYSFTVINTGEGAKVGLFSNKAHDIYWSNLTLKKLNSSFASLGHLVAGSDYASIDKVQKSLKDNFGSPKTTKYTHQLQVNGTCSYDSIMCWLETFVNDPNLMIEFQFHIVQNALNALKLETRRGIKDNDVTLKRLSDVISAGKKELEKLRKLLPAGVVIPETRNRAFAQFTIFDDPTANLNEEIRLLKNIQKRGIAQLFAYKRYLAAKNDPTIKDLDAILHENDQVIKNQKFQEYQKKLDQKIDRLGKEIKKLEKSKK